MVAGLKFLSKKSFNPKNTNNQKTVWERQQEKAAEEKRIHERERQLQRERDEEELAKARGDLPRLGFMYTAPPGLDGAASSSTTKRKQDINSGGTSTATTTCTQAPASQSNDTTPTDVLLLSQRQPGDDEAAAAFRALLASSSIPAPTSPASDKVKTPTDTANTNLSSFGTVLHGTSHDPYQAALEKGQTHQQALSALEKAVGRKKGDASTGSALTLDEQIQRFPALAHAPRAKGISSSHIGVNFKPLGSQIRNVRCMACGVWGHSRGERECPVTGWNPFAASAGPRITSSDTNSALQVDSRPTRDLDDQKEHSSHGSSRKRGEIAKGRGSKDSPSSSGDPYRDSDHDSDESDEGSRKKKRRRRVRSSRRHRKRKSSSRRRHRESDSEDSSSSRSRRRKRKKEKSRSKDSER